VRVIVGLVVAIFGILNMGVYPPPEDYLGIEVLTGLMTLIGVVMVISGWLVLRTCKYEK
jgi:hypothetical protein